jgi:8-oxo-dGTP diphosphatase
MVTDHNLAPTNRCARQLQDRYGEVPVHDRTETVPPETFEGFHADSDYVGGAYAWVIRRPEDAAALSESFYGDPGDEPRVLLQLPRGETEWGLPGGGLEDEERFEDAALREVREEVGVDCQITDLWLLQRIEWTSTDAGDERSSYSLHAFFDARYEGGHISIQAGESNGAAWFAALPPDDRLMSEVLERADSWRS